MKFLKAIDWRMFSKIIGGITLILFLIAISTPKPYWTGVIVIPLLISFMILLHAHSEYIIRESKNKTKPTLREERYNKLKKLNRKAFFNRFK